MTNPLKGEASIGDHTIAFSFGTFCVLEEKTRKKMPQLLEAISEGLGFSELRDFVWAGLQQHNPGITDDAVAQLIDEAGFESASAAVGKAVSNFFGSQKAKGKNPPKAG